MEKQSITRTLIIYNATNLLLLEVLLVAQIPSTYTIAVMLVSSVIVFLLTRKTLFKHHSQIKSSMEMISAGNYSTRVPYSNIEEYDEVAESINLMLCKLENTLNHLAIHREELRLIVSTIEDVLWSQNPNGKIEWANDAFNNLFQSQELDGNKYYWEVIREPILLNLIKEYGSSTETRINELSIANSHYLLSGSYNDAAQRFVFILQNIDPIRQAEQMKKDFMVNLTHELRTPLTAIKGFSEAMEETAKPENIRFLKIIQNHTNRLISLIEDLQHLTVMEHSEKLNKQEINLSTFFENISLILCPMLEEKGIKLRIALDERRKRIHVDPFKFEQIFINLIQNSMRYSNAGEIRIKTVVESDALMIEVSDQGSGIAPEHLPRIFERFYVADPSRNKSQSGTGLGLAIVKHIVLLHEGKIEVSSELGKGCSFKIYLPTRSEKKYPNGLEDSSKAGD